MTIDIICPVYNAEKYVKTLHKSIKKQQGAMYFFYLRCYYKIDEVYVAIAAFLKTVCNFFAYTVF